ncbi:MAG: ATP-binding protein [Thermoguttaceae bacterium]|jgi:uncharacterized protein YhaN
MRFNKLHIESFGDFSQQDFDFSNGNMLLIYGGNEDGKSTLLSFMRSVCFGYAKRHGENELFARHGTASGSIEFQLKDGREGFVSRSWRVENVSPVDFTAKLLGKELTEEEFFNCVGCSDRGFFSNFFGFSYSDLATGEKLLSMSNLAHVIYGLTFGDAELFDRARNKLKERAEGLFTPRGRSQKKVTEALAAYETARLAQSKGDTAAYEKAEKELNNARIRSKELRKEQQERACRFNELELLSKAWEHYEASLAASKELRSFEESVEFDPGELLQFAKEVEPEYSAKKNSRALLEKELVSLTEACSRLERELDAREKKLEPAYLEVATQIDELCRFEKKFEEGRAGLARRASELGATTRKLNDKLVEIGVVASDASNEEIAAAFNHARRPFADTLLDEAAKNADLEARLQSDLHDSKRDLTNANGEVKKIQRNRDALAGRFQDEFGGKAHARGFKNFEKLDRSLENIRSKLEVFQREIAECGQLLEDEEKLVERLVLLPDGDDSEKETLRKRLELSNGQVEPIGLDSCRTTYESIERELAVCRNHLEKTETQIEEIDDQIKEFGVDSSFKTIDSDLANARQERSQKWETVKELLLAEGPRQITAARASATAFEVIDRKTEKLHDRRYDYALLKGKIDALYEQRDKSQEALEALHEEMNELETKRKRNVSEILNILVNYGFDFGAQWSPEVIFKWIDEWKIFNLKRGEREKQQAKAYDVVEPILPFLQQVVKTAEECRIPGADSVYLPESIHRPSFSATIATAFTEAEALMDEIRTRADRYTELCRKLENLDASLNDKREEVERSEIAARKLNAEHESLDERRRAFCKTNAVPLIELACSSWNLIKDSLEKIRDWRETVDEFDATRREYEADDAQYSRLDAIATQVADALGVDRASDSEFSSDAIRWNNKKEAARVAEAQFVDKKNDLADKKQELLSARQRMDAVNAELSALEVKVNVDPSDFVEFLEAAKQLQSLATASHACDQALATSLHASVGSKEFREALVKLEKMGDRATLEEALDQAEDELEQKAAEYGESENEVGSLKRNLEALGNKDNGLELAEEIQGSLAELRARVEEYAPIQLAYAALESSLDRFQHERKPQILKAASECFRRLTGGRYHSVSPDEAGNINVARGRRGKTKSARASITDVDEIRFNNGFDTGYYVRESDGSYKRPNQLSQGTREQLYLALRLALVEEYSAAPGAEPLPILADDVLVQFDDVRSRHAMAFLKEIADDESRQIILMTHHSATRELFRELVGENGIIDL